MHPGTVSFSAIAAPRYRRGPKRISERRSARGRTSNGCNTTRSRMLLAFCGADRFVADERENRMMTDDTPF
jgi:hypothetical protein